MQTAVQNYLEKYPPAAQNPDKKINYSKNWNGKLYCHYHTTIRLENEHYWKEREYYKIMKNGEFCYRGRLVKKTVCLLNQLPEITAYLDTGYNLEETKGLFRKMYPKADWSTQKLVILLVENIEYS